MTNEGSAAMAPDPKKYVEVALLLYTYTHKAMILEMLREEAKGAARDLEKVALVLKKYPDMVESMADEPERAKEAGLEGYSFEGFLWSEDALRMLASKVAEAMESVAEDRKKLLEFPELPEVEALVQFIESRKSAA
jgi:hypothetical protein